MARAATPAIAALVAANIPHSVLQYDRDPRNQAYGAEAVAELSAAAAVSPEQIYRTLVLSIPTGLAVAVLPVPAKLSMKGPGLEISVGPDDLIALTHAVTADIVAT